MLIAMTPSLFYFTNGFAQFGTRHYLHTFPFPIAADGFRRPSASRSDDAYFDRGFGPA